MWILRGRSLSVRRRALTSFCPKRKYSCRPPAPAHKDAHGPVHSLGKSYTIFSLQPRSFQLIPLFSRSFFTLDVELGARRIKVPHIILFALCFRNTSRTNFTSLMHIGMHFRGISSTANSSAYDKIRGYQQSASC